MTRQSFIFPDFILFFADIKLYNFVFAFLQMCRFYELIGVVFYIISVTTELVFF